MSKEFMESEFRFAMYSTLMNTLDIFAQYGKPINDIWKAMFNEIEMEVLGYDKSIEDSIASTADANDCGYCTTWEELITELRLNMLRGERIYHNKWTNETHKIDVYNWKTGKVVEYNEDEEEE